MFALLLKIAQAAIVFAQIVVIAAFMVRFVPLTCVPTFKKSELAGPLEEVEKCPRCGSEDITREDGQIACKGCGKVIKKTSRETTSREAGKNEMPIHQGEYSLSHPRTKEGDSTRAETGTDVDVKSKGSSNFVPDGLDLHMSEKKMKEIAGKAKETRSENRMTEYIEWGEGIMNSISPIPAAKRRFREGMKELAGEHSGIQSTKVMWGCIVRAYADSNVTPEEIAQECPSYNAKDLRKCEKKVRKLLRKTGKDNKHENKYERIAVETLRRVGYKKELLKLMARREIEERKSERQGKDPDVFCATTVFSLLSSVGKDISQREVERKMDLPQRGISKMCSRYDLSGLRIFEPEREGKVEPKPAPSRLKTEEGEIKRKTVRSRPKKEWRKAKLKPAKSLPT